MHTRPHDVLDRLEIFVDPSKKDSMTSWTGKLLVCERGEERPRPNEVMDRLEIIANPSKKERMTSWTGRQFL